MADVLRVGGRALLAVALLAGCAANGDEPDAAGAPTEPAPVRFALEVAEGAHGPVWVQLATESEPVAWVRVTGEGGRVFLEPRCEIPDCGETPVVCGAAIPRVRRIAGADEAGSVEHLWDGTTSVEDEAEGCERRVPAPPGEYTARICWATEADADDSLDPATGTMGRVADATCESRVFTLGVDREVVVRLP